MGVVPDSSMYEDSLKIEFSSQDIILPLGEDPPYGTAYGVLVEPVMKRFILKGWGPVFWYVKRTDVEVERVHKALTVTLSKMRQRGLGEWHPVLTEIRNPKGKINASYTYKPKAQDILTVRPLVGQGLREMVKLLSHEAAHGCWFRILTADERSEWIELFDQYTSVKTVSVGDAKRMIRSIRQIESIKAFLKEAEPEEQQAANIYLGWLKKIHNISTRDAQDLVAAGRKLPVPDTHLHRSSSSTPITLYSKESPAELFAEALSSDVVGDLGDKRIKAMVTKLAR